MNHDAETQALRENNTVDTLQSKDKQEEGNEVEMNRDSSKENKKEAEDKASKQRLVSWLGENELKLSLKHPLEVTSFTIAGQHGLLVNIGQGPMADTDQT